MSKKTSTPQKRRWYHNLKDAYTITARTYTWIPWALLGVAVACLVVSLLIGYATGGNAIAWTIIGLLTAALGAMSLLAWLVRPAGYTQIDGMPGAVHAVLSQIKSGWIIPEMPVAGTRNKDLVWRIIGRPGVVLISEGPSARVVPLLQTERKKVTRVATNVPIYTIQVGHEDNQLALKDLEKTLRHLRKVLTKEEVPAIAQRLAAVTRARPAVPHGVDPTKARPNRRALRGR